MSEVLDVALYHPQHGFYETGGAAGRGDGDFITSPETGALFGAVMARALDGWWSDLGQPDPFVVVEAGAGPGTLARMILAAQPACASALRYILVERSTAQRARHGERLPLEDPALVLPPIDAESGQAVPEAPTGPLCASLAELPRLSGLPAVVLANELLDNLPFDLAVRHDQQWHEVRVTFDPAAVGPGDIPTLHRPDEPAPTIPAAEPERPATTSSGQEAEPGGPATASAGDIGPAAHETLVPLDQQRAGLLDRLVSDPTVGARVPLQSGAQDWLRDALQTAGPRGRVVVFDYGTDTAELARRPADSWLRTYRRHARGAGYLEALGQQDVTCEVALDQLTTVRHPTSDSTQRVWLERWGIHELVAEAERTWADRAHLGDLQALAARSRINESRALLDPQGLGAFRVLEWGGG